MKQYSFSTEDLKYLTPLEAVRVAMENQVKTYIISVVMPRMGLKKEEKVNYDVFGGILKVIEEIVEKGNESNSSPKKSK